MSESENIDVADDGNKTSDIEKVELPPSRNEQILRIGGTFLLVAAAGFLGGWPLLAMVGAFAISILVHEAGHYFVAKRAGMKATEFFVGFGPKIFSFRKGETEYGLKAIPAGAYVRIIGMSNLEKVAPEDEDRTYRSKPFRWRFATVVAGPGANILLAFLLLLGINLFAAQPNFSKWEAERSVPGTTAAVLNIQPGERIASVNGIDLPTYQKFVEEVRLLPSEVASFTIVSSDGSERNATGKIGWRIGAEGQAALPPLVENDIIVAVGDTEAPTFDQFASQINSLEDGKTIPVYFSRNGGVYLTDIQKPTTPLTAEATIGYIGVSPTFPNERLPVGAAFSRSFTMGKDMVVASVKGIGAFFSLSGLSAFGSAVISGGESSSAATTATITEIAPPVNGGSISSSDQSRILSIVGVVRLGAQAADASIFAFLTIWILINVFLAVINLLPLLPFDGGHAVVSVWEKIRGVVTKTPTYRVDIAKLIPLSYAVIAFFLIIGLSAMWLDITSPIQNPFS